MRLTLRRWSAAALLALAGIELHAQTQTVRLYLEALDECGPVTGLTRNDIAIFDRASTQYVLEYSNSTGEPSADLKVSLLRDGVKTRMSRAGRIRD